TPTRNVALNLYESPVLRLPDGTFKPVLAESWENPDSSTWIFHIRKGVKFHNGNDFTADDIKFTMERITDPNGKSPRAANWPSLESIEAPDPTTLIIKTKGPYPLTLARMSGSFDTVSRKY